MRDPGLLMRWGLAGALLLFGGAPLAKAQVSTARPDTAQVDTVQATRAAQLRAQRRGKTLRRPGASLLDRVAVRLSDFVERNQIVIDLPEVNFYGLKPVLGGLRAGAGTTGGLRYELFDDRSGRTAHVEALASLRRYYGTNAVFGDEDARFVRYLFARYWHMPEEAFYGIGPGAGDEEVSFRLNQSIAGGLFGFSPLPGVLAGAQLSLTTSRFGPGHGDEPMLRERFAPDEVPGFGADVNHLRPSLWAEYDSRDLPYVKAYGSRFAPTESRLRGISLDATRGFYVAAELVPHFNLGGGPYDFTWLNVEAQQYFPIRHAFQVIALRQFVSVTQTGEDNQVPFYLMQTLGGSHTLRGYRSFRFRDRNAALLNAEYRWHVLPALDFALFLDAGQVFGEVKDFRFDKMKTSYGLGARLRSGDQVVLRLDLARSTEGVELIFKIGSIL